jgi:hypothetical protein
MIRKIIASVVVVLSLGVGVAYAATELTAADDTQVCVNEGSGLMRVASTCRTGEYALTIGGASDVVVTQNGTVTVDVGENAGKTLPLTGITITGRCEFLPAAPPYLYDQVIAHIRLDAASGETMDILPAKVIGGSSWEDGQVLAAAGVTPGYGEWSGGNFRTYVVSSRGATATITVSAIASWTPQTCSFLWQATEAPN